MEVVLLAFAGQESSLASDINQCLTLAVAAESSRVLNVAVEIGEGSTGACPVKRFQRVVSLLAFLGLRVGYALPVVLNLNGNTPTACAGHILKHPILNIAAACLKLLYYEVNVGQVAVLFGRLQVGLLHLAHGEYLRHLALYDTAERAHQLVNHRVFV